MADYTLSAKITGNSDSFQKACSNAKKALSDIQKNFSSVSSSLNKTGKELTSKITKPALAAGTALAGVTLGKGFTRLTAIDTAKAKLEALGNSAENVTDIMKSANASVKGTSYGLDEAATTASSAVAAGIKPGQELTRYLSLTADAAATAGRTMSDMGSIFNKVQTSQAAYTEELNQLADSGIPIYQWLGEEAGLSAAEVKKMASEGEITSEMFLNAVEKNIGGAAKIVGEKSFTGVLSNIWASVGRIGTNFLDANGSGQGFFTQMKPLMVEFKNYLGTLEEKAATWGQVFGESFSGVIQYFKTGKVEVDGFTDSAAKIVTKLQPIIDVVKKVTNIFSEMSPKMQASFAGGAVAAGPLISVLAKVTNAGGSVAGTIGKAFGTVGGTVSSFKGGFSSLVSSVNSAKDPIKALGSSFSGVFGKISSLGSKVSDSIGKSVGSLLANIPNISMPFIVVEEKLKNVVGTIKGNLSSTFSKFGGFASKVGDALSSVLGVCKNFGGQFTSVLMKAFGFGAIGGLILVGLGMIQQNFGDKITEILTMVQEKAPQIVTDFCTGIVSKIPDLIAQGGELIANLLSTITALAPSVISGGADIVINLVNGLASQLPTLLSKAGELIITIVKGLTEKLPDILKSGMNVISSLVEGISSFLPDLIPAAVDMILELAMGLVDNLPTLIDSGIQLLTSIVEGITNAIPKIAEKAPEIICKLATTLIDKAPELIVTAGKLILQLATGLIQAIPTIIKKIPEIIGAIKDKFLDTDWAQLGKDIMGLVVDGFKAIVNLAIDGINWIIDKINYVPGIDIPHIPYLLHGTDDWQGGFAYMNEGGRGELVNLPNGSQVIPHDISVHYAKEAARANASESFVIDYDYLINGMAAAMSKVSVHHTSTMDGKVVSDTTSPLVDDNLGTMAMLERRFA